LLVEVLFTWWGGYLLEIQHDFALGTNATLQIYRKI
jgi:hypothetical protein